MEIWDVVALVLGSNVIMGVVTFFATKIQVKHSDKRFEKELKRQREIDTHKRKQEVRDSSLLKLRGELAQMAVKLDNLVASAQRTHTRFGGTQEEAEEKLQKAVDDWNSYLENGGLANTLFIQYDPELVDRVEKIRKDYHKAYFNNLNFQKSNAEDMIEAFNIFEKGKVKIIEVQELINKRLEEL